MYSGSSDKQINHREPNLAYEKVSICFCMSGKLLDCVKWDYKVIYMKSCGGDDIKWISIMLMKINENTHND